MNISKDRQKYIDLKFNQRGLKITYKKNRIEVDSFMYNNNDAYKHRFSSLGIY